MHRILVVPLPICVALTVIACSSSGSSSQPVQDPTFASTGASTSAPVSSAAPAAGSTATISTAAPGIAAAPSVPAVTDGSDLTKKPTIGSGTELPSVLVVRDLVTGTGPVVSSTATVKVKYVGTIFSTGVVFDASWGKSGSAGADAASFALSGVIPGFARGLIGMKTGGRREIVIPPALGYGTNATGSIPANSTLVFVVDMVSTTG